MRDKMLRGTYRLLLALAPLLFALPITAFAVCSTDAECIDTVFCNGTERCTPGAPGADAEGCSADPAGSPCVPPADMCDEATARCFICAVPEPDRDGDGHADVACGGDDCDDSDSRRYPGNAETCDDRDDDCDPSTFGDVDADNDGFFDGQCCNPNSSVAGGVLCGDDCDDSNPAIIPGAMMCGSNPGDVLVCNPGGFFQGGYQPANCGGVDQQVCVQQPNGTGVCQWIKKPPNL